MRKWINIKDKLPKLRTQVIIKVKVWPLLEIPMMAVLTYGYEETDPVRWAVSQLRNDPERKGEFLHGLTYLRLEEVISWVYFKN